MNITQLETFLTLSRTMSFRKTGEILRLTQPAVSAQIKNLEDEFHIVLIDRNHPLTLTEGGKLFAAYAEHILNTVQELRLKLSDLEMEPQGHIQIGTTTSIAMQILPKILSYFQNQYPKIKTTIHSMTSSQIISSVESGSIDLGIGYLFEKSNQIEATTLYYDHFVLVAAPTHPLCQPDSLQMDTLHTVPFIMLAPETAGRRFVDQLFKSYNISPPIVMELSSSEEVKRMVELNMGAAIVSKLSISEELRRQSLRIIPVEQLNVVHPVGVMVRSGKYLNVAMRQFLSDLKEMPEMEFTQ
jgi:DNA-binding transcriptional LysR family regulator